MIGSTQSDQVGEAPPAPFRWIAPGILRVTRGGGPIAVFGAPFFLAGVFMLLGSAGIVHIQNEGGGPATMLVPMGLLFLAIGSVLVFGRQRLVLDVGRRSILRQTSVLVALWTEERALSEFQSIVMSHHPGDAETAETYPVTLHASTGKDSVIVKPLQFAESLAAAEFLARALSLQLVDATTDREIVVSAERTGESLRDRLSRAPAGAPPGRPPTMRSEVTESAGETRIVMSRRGPAIADYAGVVLPIIVFVLAMVFAIPVFLRSAKPLVLLGMLLVLFGAPTMFAIVRYLISDRRKRITVTASRAGLMLEQPGNKKMPSIAIPADEVLDVDFSTFESAVESARRSVYRAGTQRSKDERVLRTLKKLIPNPGIVIKSRSGLFTIGEGLQAEELQYLVWLIRKALIG